MMRLCLLALLCLAGCGDDDYNGDSGTQITVDASANTDLTGITDDGGVDLSVTD